MKKITEIIKEKSSLVLIVIIVLLLSVIALSYFTIKFHSGYVTSDQQIDTLQNKFELLSPSIAWMATEDFLAVQKTYTVNYRELKTQVINQLATASPSEQYGFYFEDLNTGSWIGVNEKDKFLPMSLFKVPLMVAILKKVEEGDMTLDQNITIKQEDLDTESGDLAAKGAGYEMTVQELITTMIHDSDNTAMKALSRFTTNEDYVRAISMMGLPQPSEQQMLSPKEYINIFRSLYFSTYLRRPFSELALTVLLDTKFDSQLPAGLPQGIKTSHKVGFDVTRGYYHDCGIVYKPEHPYLFCVMSQNTTQQKADKMISTLSKIVYDYDSKIPADVTN